MKSQLFSRLAVAVLLATGATQVAHSQTIPESIDSILNRSQIINLDMGVLIENESGSIEYYSKNPDLPMVPASNMKIFTTAAAFGLLGESHAFETHIYYSGTLSSGNISGNLYVIGEHDPTWNTTVLGSGNADDGLELIAQRIRNAGVTSISGNVIGQGAMSWGRGSTNTGHNNISATASENDRVADQLLAELNAIGTTVSGSGSGTTGFTPPGGSTLLLTYLSTELNDGSSGQPLNLAEACIGLNKSSHNVMADYLLRHIGYIQSGSDTYTAGETAALNWFQNTAGLDITGMNMADGSGLSRSDFVTARQTVDIVRYMDSISPAWIDTLPIGGVDGTLGGRLGAISGTVLAKTGTLPSSGAVSLSGLINHDLDDQKYYFSWLENTEGLSAGSTESIDTTNGRDVIDDSLVAFSDVFPPVSVDIRATRRIDASTLRVEWDDNALAGDTYTVREGQLGGSFTDVATVSTSYIIESGRSDTSLGLNNSDYSDSGPFQNSSAHSAATGLTGGIGSRFILPSTDGAGGNGTATFTPSGLSEGRYRVDVTCFNFESADAHNTEVRITDRINSPSSAFFDLSEDTAGNVWRSVGSIDFVPGQGHRVEFRNNAQASNGTNDGISDRLNPAAIRFVPLYVDLPIPSGAGNTVEYQVVVNGPRSLPSEISDTFSYGQASPEGNQILVVEGFDRWDTIADNTDRDSHTFAAITANSIIDAAPGLDVDTVSNDAVIDGQVDLDDYAAVFWVLGEESTADETFSSAEQTLVENYLNGNGNFFVSGSEIAWDLDRDSGPTTADRAFMNNVLRADFGSNANDDANTYNFQQQSNTLVTGGLFDSIASTLTFDNGTGPTYDVTFPDILLTQNGSQGVLTYVGGSGGTAAIGFDGSGSNEGKLIYLGFGFETILSQSGRDDMALDALTFFDILPPVGSVGDWMVF